MDVSKIVGILLADGWHDVAPSTFKITDFTVEQGPATNVIGPGFGFSEVGAHGSAYRGPLRSVIAVRVSP